MIFDDYTKFEESVPTASGTDTDELISFFIEAESWLQNDLLGTGLYNKINTDRPEAEVKACQTIICLKAYNMAIPFVDLIQTNNGFAVVRNTNQAPASPERVERLLKQVNWRLSESVDILLRHIFSTADLRDLWVTDDISLIYTEVVYLTASELRFYSGNKDANRDILLTLHADILRFQEDCTKHLSRNYLDALFEKRSSGAWTDYDKKVFRALQTIIGLMFQKKEFYPWIEKTVNYMVENLSEFPDYEVSAAYRVKIGQKYENKKWDSTFFFGG